MIHDCERRRGKIYEVLLSRDGRAFCSSCRAELQDDEIAEEILAIIKKRRQKNQRWKKN
jgi:hypothetical protein